MTPKNILRGFSIAVFLCLCLSLSNVTRRARAQRGQAEQGNLPVEQTRKNIQVLKGLPESQLFPVMNFVAASLGVRCDFCHVKQAAPAGGETKWIWESDEKEYKRVARQMMRMTLDINKARTCARLPVCMDPGAWPCQSADDKDCFKFGGYTGGGVPELMIINAPVDQTDIKVVP